MGLGAGPRRMGAKMELKWTKPEQQRAAGFANNSSPYAHFWLDQRELAQPRSAEDAKRRSVVQIAEASSLGLEDLLKRAFE